MERGVYATHCRNGKSNVDMMNLYHEIECAAQAHAERTAFDCGDAGAFTFAEMLAHSEAFAAVLVEMGVAPGDRVAVQVDKDIGVVWLYLAVLRVGAIYLPLNTLYTDNEISYFVADAEPVLLVVNEVRHDSIGALPEVRRCGAAVTTLAALAERGAGSGTAASRSRREGDDIAAILYTSGTTGRSKGAMLSHRNLVTNARTLVQEWGFTSRDVLLHALPIYHVHGLFVALHCALLAGATVRFLARFDVESVLAALPQSTVFMGVPTYYTRLLSVPQFPAGAVALRLWISGSAPLLPETFEAFRSRTGATILERYGMTEAGMITSNPLLGARRAGTVGRALAGVEVRVRAADGTLAAAGDPGILEIRGESVFAGYWRNDEKSRAAFTADGYFITGDIVTLDSEGVVSIVGRQSDLIISGGLNVYPKEVESEIDALPGIEESAVVGVPHPDFGEAVIAVVAARNAFAEADVIERLRTRLAAFKVPKRVFRVDDLPRNAMGKVQKKALRETYAGLFEAAR
jgi:malonyl-CoA/methylmalonyl-CoA synthetase